jgi:hypothetical protein
MTITHPHSKKFVCKASPIVCMQRLLYIYTHVYIIYIYMYTYQVFLKQVVLPAAAVIAFGAILPLLAQGPGVARLLQVCVCM